MSTKCFKSPTNRHTNRHKLRTCLLLVQYILHIATTSVHYRSYISQLISKYLRHIANLNIFIKFAILLSPKPDQYHEHPYTCIFPFRTHPYSFDCLAIHDDRISHRCLRTTDDCNRTAYTTFAAGFSNTQDYSGQRRILLVCHRGRRSLPRRWI